MSSAKKTTPFFTGWKKYTVLVGMLFLFPLAWLLLFGVYSKHNFRTLIYYGPEAPQGAAHSDYVIPDFSFINHEGDIFTRDSLKGKIWIAAFYSTADEHIVKLTERMLDVNWKYRDEADIGIVVFSTNTEFDTPEVLGPYIERNTRYNTAPGKWQFLTGNQAAMSSYIRNGFLIQDLSSEAIFRLIDREGHIRGLYGNTEYHIKDAIEDIALLKKEYDLIEYQRRKEQENAQ